MENAQYKVVPAPQQGKKAKNAKSTPDRFALALTDILNELAAEGWDYVRAETLPCDERKGLTGMQTTFQNMLIFRRAADVVETSVMSQKDAPVRAEQIELSDPLPQHAHADPVSEALGDTLRATRAPENPASRRLGPADGD